ncbi:MAG: hypothetical protein H6706_24080 [Myxococcales bacterium]|nr:hypothetical protein [Myxococcales bacterium]
MTTEEARTLLGLEADVTPEDARRPWARLALFGLVTVVVAVLHLKGWGLSALFGGSQPLTPPITRTVAGLALPLDSAPPSAHNADSERPGEAP